MGSLINALPGAVSQGLVWGIMALGVYVTYRILDVADLTVDGSLATGGAVCVMMIRAGVNPWVALLLNVEFLPSWREFLRSLPSILSTSE